MKPFRERYALRHVDAAGTLHVWTCGPASAHWVARWHARDSGRPTAVLRDIGWGWVEVTVWTPCGEPTNDDWMPVDDDGVDQRSSVDLDGSRWRLRPVTDYSAL